MNDNNSSTVAVKATLRTLHICFENAANGFKLRLENDIVNGGKYFIGLIPLIQKYLESRHISIKTKCKIDQYLQSISERASGKTPTTAAFIRKFVSEHPDYKKDSVITDKINFDLLSVFKQQTE